MTIALLTGRSGSKSIRKKNLMEVLGRPLASYPILSALNSKSIDVVYISTDCPDLQALALSFGVRVIPRPAEISGDSSELAHAIEHALTCFDERPDYLVTHHCNSGTHRPGLVDECLEKLKASPEADSCVTGSIDKSVHPYRTRRVTPEGTLALWSEIPQSTSSNRQSLTPCFVLDGAVRAMRVKNCFPVTGHQPFPYLGKTVLYVENEGGRDIHCLEDVYLTERYLERHGWSHAKLPPEWR